MDYLEEEKRIVKYMLNFLKENINARNDFDFKYRLYDYIYKLCMVEAKKINYKVETHYNINQIDFDNIIYGKDIGVLHLIFSDVIDGDKLRLGYYGRNIDFKNKRFDAPVMIITNAGISYVLNSSKLNPEYACINILNIIFHELRHMKQEFFAKANISNNIGIIYVKEYFLKGLYGNNYYLSSLKERDANLYAIKKLNEVAKNISKCDLNFNHKFNINNCNNIQIDEYVSRKFDEILKKVDLECVFSMYPILTKEYNMDGTRKDAITLYNNMNREINDIINNLNLDIYEKKQRIYNCKNMYFEIMFRSIDDAKKDIFYRSHNLFNEMIEFFLEKNYKEEKDTINFVNYDYSDILLRRKYYQKIIGIIEDSVQSKDLKEKLKGKLYRNIYKNTIKNT